MAARLRLAAGLCLGILVPPLAPGGGSVMAQERPVPRDAPAAPAVLRLTFAYEGDQVRLVSRQRVEMTLPPSDPLHGPEGQQGFSYTVSDAEGRVVFRRVAPDPMRRDVEVFSGPGTSPSRQPVTEPRGTFVLLVPETAEGRTLRLLSDRPAPGARAGAPREMARFDLAPGPPATGP